MKNEQEIIKNLMETANSITHSLDERNKTDVPADKFTTDLIQSGKAKLLYTAVALVHKNARFVVIQRPLGHKGKLSANQDRVMMAIISDPTSGKIKMFSYHGTHINVDSAVKFAKNNKLIGKNEDSKGQPKVSWGFQLDDSNELDEMIDESVVKKGKPIPMDLLYPKGHPLAGEIVGGKKKERAKGLYTAVAIEVNKDYPTGKWVGNIHSLEKDEGIWKTAAMTLQKKNKTSGSKINIAIEDDKGKVVKIFKES